MDVSRSAGVCRAPSLFAAPPIVAPAGMHSFVYLEDPRTKTLCGTLSDSLKLVRTQRDSIMHISCSALNDSRAGDDDIGATSSSKNAENGAAVANTSPMVNSKMAMSASQCSELLCFLRLNSVTELRVLTKVFRVSV